LSLSRQLSEYRRIVSEIKSNNKLANSMSNSEKNILSNQIAERKEQISLLELKVKDCLKIIEEKSARISELQEEIIFLNSKILSKEETIIQITEKVEKASDMYLNDFQAEKVSMESKLKEIKEECKKLVRENNLNLNEIESHKNINLILEKQIEIYEMKLKNK